MPKNNSKKTEVKKFTGKKFLLWIFSFFGIIIGMNILMTYIAINTFSGLESKDAYKKGREYNETLEKADQQALLGWSEAVTIKPLDSKGTYKITVKLMGATRKEELGAKLFLRHPATTKLDKEISLVRLSPEIFEGVTEGIRDGRWKWTLLINQGGEILYRKNGAFMTDKLQ